MEQRAQQPCSKNTADYTAHVARRKAHRDSPKVSNADGQIDHAWVRGELSVPVVRA